MCVRETEIFYNKVCEPPVTILWTRGGHVDQYVWCWETSPTIYSAKRNENAHCHWSRSTDRTVRLRESPSILLMHCLKQLGYKGIGTWYWRQMYEFSRAKHSLGFCMPVFWCQLCPFYRSRLPLVTSSLYDITITTLRSNIMTCVVIWSNDFIQGYTLRKKCSKRVLQLFPKDKMFWFQVEHFLVF